ncbi:hypothetical protein R1flu_011603 [Riccia fluitans]|uniref:Pyrrolo-quinoline quinone n=1 Tax=Riccia fluitans TaxID=41844 RepID=A0ABD1Z897_9MARC
MGSYAQLLFMLSMRMLFSFSCLLSEALAQDSPPPYVDDQWLNHGRDLTNDRWARAEELISPTSAGRLAKKWIFTADGDVTASPSIADGVIYFPDWSGSLFAVVEKTRALVWKRNMTALAATSLGTGNRTLFSRATPTIDGDRLLVSISGPCAVVALNRFTGDLLWGTVLDPHPYAITTMSGTAFEGYTSLRNQKLFYQ